LADSGRRIKNGKEVTEGIENIQLKIENCELKMSGFRKNTVFLRIFGVDLGGAN